MKLGVLIGNRGFFPSHLCEQGREKILAVLEEEGIEPVVLDASIGAFGSVESPAETRQCAELFKQHREEIAGVLITLPNFGDEKAIANALRLSELDVPILVHAFGDDQTRMTIQNRRDSFCGKISVCNNLRQYGIPFTLTTRHTTAPDSDDFRADLRRFLATCRVVKGLRRARIGAVGARPAAFNTVRYSEKILENNGISVETLDLSEMLGWANALSDTDASVVEKLRSIQSYTETKGIPETSLNKMSRLGVVLDRWISDLRLDATAIQCWTALEEFYGVVPCTLMSMLSEGLKASACETDVMGAVSMLSMQLAAQQPSALLDWNNNYGSDPDKCVVFHCSNLPQSVFAGQKMDYQEIIAGTVGAENTYGTIVGRMRATPFTFCRATTDDFTGEISAYVGQGELTDDMLQTFGGYGVAQIPNLQNLLKFICENGFEHHVALNLSVCAEAVAEAMENYLGWNVYRHA